MEDTPREIYPFSSSYGRNSTFWFNDKLDASGHLPEPEEEFATLYDAPVEVVVLLSIFYGGISIIAVIGNTLVIWVVATTRQMHTVTNMYIANLAFADVIIGMFCIPFQFQAALLQRWNLPEFMCAFCPFVQVLSVNVSVFTLTAIAVDRHRAIINPLRARPTRFISKVIITSIWIAAVSFAIPIAIAFRVIPVTEKIREHGVVRNVTRPFCENVNLTDEQLQTYRYYLVFVQYVVPFCVISFVYIQMAVKLWGSRTPGNAQDARDITLLRNKKKVIKMLIIVVVVFGVCWLPLQTYNILHVTWPAVNEYRYINIIWFSCDWLAMSNSCYNPFIYGIYNEKFKREFNKRFSVCFCKFRTNDSVERTMSIYTRASSIRSNYTNSSTRCRNNVLTHAQHRNNGTKVHDGYSAITDLNQKDTVHNNLQAASKAAKAAFWFQHPTDDHDFHGYIATDCACRILSEDEWDQDRECDGSCLTGGGGGGGNFINTNNSSTIEQNKSKSIRIVRNCMTGNAVVNGKGIGNNKDEIRKSCILEMDELRLATTGNGKNSVKFNNF